MVDACNCRTGETEAEGAEVLRLSPLSTESRDIGHLRYQASKDTTQNKLPLLITVLKICQKMAELVLTRKRWTRQDGAHLQPQHSGDWGRQRTPWVLGQSTEWIPRQPRLLHLKKKKNCLENTTHHPTHTQNIESLLNLTKLVAPRGSRLFWVRRQQFLDF